MSYKLGINTGFAVNRYAEHEEWTKIINKAGANYAQFTADLLNVSLPKHIVKEETSKIVKSCLKNNIIISSTFTGAFTRVNHLAHPNPIIRNYWIEWFKNFVDLTLDLGCKVMGSHFGILTLKDFNDHKIRKKRIQQNIKAWHEIALYGKKKGIKHILWEPMSVGRELGETIENCEKLNEQVNKDSPLPFKLCLDVDHGDVSSKNSNDTDPYYWIKKFGKISPVIHLKQSLENKGGHWPFTDEYNKIGKIKPDKIINLLKELSINECDLILELSFREREPFDSNALDTLTESVNYWNKYLD